MTAVVVDGQNGKEYRLPTEYETQRAEEAEKELPRLFSQIPFGLPEEPLPSKEALGFRIPLYGFNQWKKLFTFRQLFSLGMFVKHTRESNTMLKDMDYSDEWREAIEGYLALALDRLASMSTHLCRWESGSEFVVQTFVRFALPILWDFTETAVLSDTTGNYYGGIDWIARFIDHANFAVQNAVPPKIKAQSATVFNNEGGFDFVLTDPPYYDAIPYSDLMDFFYVWLRRSLYGFSSEIGTVFSETLSPKWNHKNNDGELIDDTSRHGGDKVKSKTTYEEGMFRAFRFCNDALSTGGRLVVVFAHKKPDAWETLASAIIRAGFIVDGSWPIQTERIARSRAHGSAALSSSVWLVCKKRPITTRSGWDNQVLEEMRQNIKERLREYWDAGIRGPDFVWAATGPALEAYSKHPIVKKANEPGILTVNEFLNHVRRIVVDFVVGRVLSHGKEGDAELATADRLDEPTAYYLLHRNDFGLEEAPAGACILYAISCGISDKELADTWNLISFTKGKSTDDSDEEEIDVDAEADEIEKDSGSKVKLKTWAQRKSRSLGYETSGGKPIPLIDRVHRLMHLWKEGDLHKVDAYLDDNGLRRHELFKRLLQSLIELSPHGSEERSLLESISNHIQAKGAVAQKRLPLPGEE